MREIKFRVWSEEDKEYRSDIKVSDLVIDKDGVPSTIYNNEGDRFDIEQYTGLKDENGSEIYEGDIVQIYKGGVTYGVAWMNKYGGWFCLSNNDEHYEPLYNAEFEVIGNIHENPELLKKEK